MKDGIEEKAKRYDEAIERAKGVIEQNPLMEYLKKGIEYIFPELKESEDERIRKWLIEYFKNINDEVAYEDRGKIITWLEKQSEQKHTDKIEHNAWSEEDERNLDWLITVCERIHYKSDPQVAPDSALMLKDWLKSLKDRFTWKPSE